MNNKEEKLDLCVVCQKPAQNRCEGCCKVWYCNKQHQKEDWREHKRKCKPFKICENLALGRHLTATRSLKPGDVIIQEQPLIWGPSLASIPVCLGCNRTTTETTTSCKKCGWPICSDLCEKSPSHIPECKYTTQRGEKITIKDYNISHPIYKCVIVLRCLYQKQFLQKNWKKLEELETHLEERKLRADYESKRVAISEFIRRFFKLENVFSEEEVMTAWGIVTINSHEVPLTNPPHIAIYSLASLLEHNCTANCSKTFTKEGKIVITAAQEIQEGDHLSICYTDPLWGTQSRRNFLYETRFFWCQCPRCEDPTEFGTYFSAIKCQKLNCSGFLLPPTFTNNQKLHDWVCTTCHQTMSSYCVHDILERIGRELFDLDKTDPKVCTNFLKTYGTYLPENHFYFTEVKYRLAQILGQNGLHHLDEDDLDLKLQCCEDLEGLVKVIAPSEKRVLGTILFEKHAAVAELSKRNGDVQFLDSRSILLQAINLLKDEADVLPEGKIYIQAKKTLQDINNSIFDNADSDDFCKLQIPAT